MVKPEGYDTRKQGVATFSRDFSIILLISNHDNFFSQNSRVPFGGGQFQRPGRGNGHFVTKCSGEDILPTDLSSVTEHCVKRQAF
ncbi:hypothetical protein CEXT_368751 [Caerostris extrusa]|uniref:Uncharacterized protein n=1 Tax=Caerostris extrusa TaxID=172846 RepID=A0AAV4Q8K4_CAEEX|nr:hypothetical protein CEXT_368751 [Caerostris extrusa]